MTNDQARNRGWLIIGLLVLLTDALCLADGSRDALICGAALTAVYLFDLWVVYG